MIDTATRLGRMRALGLRPASELAPRPKGREVAKSPSREVGPADLAISRSGDLAPALEYVDETPKRQRRDDVTVTAEQALGLVWVSLLSIEGPVPRSFADQRGVLPVWVELNADWRRAGADVDRQHWSARVVRLAVLGVRGDARGERLKAALETALGVSAERHDAEALRQPKFRNAVDFGPFDDWWPPLLSDVVARLELEDREARIWQRGEADEAVRREVGRRAAMRMRGR